MKTHLSIQSMSLAGLRTAPFKLLRTLMAQAVQRILPALTLLAFPLRGSSGTLISPRPVEAMPSSYAPASRSSGPQDAQRALQGVDRRFFIENKGQWPQEVLYLARLGGLDAWITRSGVVYDFYKLKEIESSDEASPERPLPDKFQHKEMARYGHVVRAVHTGAGIQSSGQGLQKQEGYYNYFIGNDPSRWASEVGLYKEAVVKDLYPGIDVRWYYEGKALRFDYIVNPGADPALIHFVLEGSEKTFTREGQLTFATRFGEVGLMDLQAYQETEKGRVPATVRWQRRDNGWAFSVEGYDPKHPLVIDPLVYSTFIGEGIFNGESFSIALNGSGEAYVTGYTSSTDFPTTSGAYDITLNSPFTDNGLDAFVTKLNPSGSALVYSTFLGGSNVDWAYCIAVDGSGAAYVTGYTQSADFPTTSGAFDETYNGGIYDAFVTKLNPSGSALVYSTFLGGSNYDWAYDIAVDGSGAAYVTGYTGSSNFPTTPGAYDITLNGSGDAFVTKLNPLGSALVYSTFLGGSNGDGASGIAVDGSGAAYVTGSTNSSDFPTTSGAYDITLNGSWDAFVTKLNPSGSALVYSTFLGGSDGDNASGIAVDGSGAAYVTGSTTSSDFPTTSGAFDITHNSPYTPYGDVDAFVTKLNPSGSALVYSTFLGGSNVDWAYCIAVDGSGAAYVAGYTQSADFPTTPGAYDITYNINSYSPYNNPWDGFVTKLNSSGSALVYSTFLGGSDDEVLRGIAVDGNGAAYVTGWTGSSNFPTTPGAYDETFPSFGVSTVYVAKLFTTCDLVTFYQDSDADGYGNPAVSTVAFCSVPSGYVINNTDCNDANAAVKPTATEACNGIDDDCDALVDLDDPSVSNVSVGGPLNATVCVGLMSSLAHATTGATGIGTPTGLPPGMTASFNSMNGGIILSGSPSSLGTYTYSIPVYGCDTIFATGTITVNPAPTVTGTADATACADYYMMPIELTTTDVTGIGWPTGLPTGVTASFYFNTLTISGTPFGAGTYNYSIPLVTGCGLVNATGTITVSSFYNTFLYLTAGNNNQTVCVNSAINDIFYGSSGVSEVNITGLPSGVTYVFNNSTGQITISGTPTETGTFDYTITGIGPCYSPTASGTITVLPPSSITWDPSSGPENQTVCLFSPLTNINYTTTSVWSFTSSNLPQGVVAGTTANGISILGTPYTPGTYNYTISVNGGCGVASVSGQIVVEPYSSLSLTSGIQSTFQTVCVGTPITPITGNVNNASGVTFTNLPPGVSGIYSGGVLTISGTPTQPGNYVATVHLIGCGPGNSNIYINVIPLGSAALSSGAGSDNQTVCINTPINPITYGVNNVISGGAHVTGLPTGTFYSYNNSTGVLTISGSPSQTGTYNYTVYVVNSCNSQNTVANSGTITVTPNNTVTGPGSATVCVGTAMTPLIHTTTGATGIGTPTGLPPGVTAAFSSNTITISGTPTAAGTYNYSIPLTGGCGPVNATGTITVTPNNTVTGPGSATVCVGTAMTPLIHATTGATGIGSPTGLPPGVTAAFSSNTITISGTPTAAGTYNYSIPLTGGCGPVNATGTITVNPDNTVTGPGSATVCVGTALTPFTHTTTGATGIGTPTGLPPGVTASFSSNTITISGTPTAAGTYNYSIPLTGGCGPVNATGTITVTPNNTVTGPGSATVCVGTALTPITHTTTGATGINTPSGLPPGVIASFIGNTLTISGTPTATGTYNYSIPLTGGCGSVNATGTITVTPAININIQPPYQACVGSYASWQIPVSNASSVSVTGLPPGVSSAFNASNQTLYINGTPNQAGTYNVQIQASGSVCSTSTALTFTVTPQTSLNLVVQPPTYLPNSNNQVVCLGQSINQIRFEKSSGSTFFTSGSLPPGVTFTTSGNFLNISGTPMGGVNQTFTFNVMASGPCGTQLRTVSIRVVPGATPLVQGYSYNPNPAPGQPHIFISRPSGHPMPPLTIILPTCSIPYRSLPCQSLISSPFIPVNIADNTPNNPLFPSGVSCSVQGTHLVISGTPSGGGTFRFTVSVNTCCGPITIRVQIMLYQIVTLQSSHLTLCADDLMKSVPVPTDSLREIRNAEAPSWLHLEAQKGLLYLSSQSPQEGNHTVTFTTVDETGEEAQQTIYLQVNSCPETEPLPEEPEQTTTVAETEQESPFEYYPNPTADQVTIYTQRPGGMLQLYSTEGQILESRPWTSERGVLNLNRYPTGLYLLRYTTPEGEVHFGKIMKVE